VAAVAVEATRLLHKIKEVTLFLIAGLILLHRFPLIQVQAVATKAQTVQDGVVLVNDLNLDPLRPHVKNNPVTRMNYFWTITIEERKI